MGKDAVEKINEIWNAAEKQAEEAWCEMDEFLKLVEAEGPSKTEEQMERRREQFLTIQKRQVERSLHIAKRASALSRFAIEADTEGRG